MARVFGLLVPSLVMFAAIASAENRLGIWPGMTVEQATATLKARCPNVEVEGDDQRFISCQTGEAADATIVNATASTKGRVYYIAWHEASSDAVMDYAKRIAGEFGLSGSGKDCRFYGYELRCWNGTDGSVLYAGERDADNRYVNYIVNDRIKEEDDGPSTEAPVNLEE